KYANMPLITTIIADASDFKTLQKLGINEIETVIVGTPNNIEIVAILLELNVEHIIARASSIGHARVLKQIGVNLIVRPEKESGTRTALIATNSNFIKFSRSLTELGDGFVIGSTQLLDAKYTNIPLKNLQFNKFNVSIVLVKRANESFLPTGDFVLNLGDELTIVGKITNVTKIFALLNEQYTTENKRTKWRKY
ncbi:MAG: TrkA family potassium uptake protein, partial [Mycoplasmataceae bacterium]|nr:TrkA family potassium uptake protein [Mycoplasmataceae bacterium]